MIELILKGKELESGKLYKNYSGANLKLEETQGIFYFACSIFWRASEWPTSEKKTHKQKWPDHENLYKGALGKNSENFRLFLLEGKLLKKVNILAILSSQKNQWNSIFLPELKKNDSLPFHRFAVPGIFFYMFINDQEEGFPDQHTLTENQLQFLVSDDPRLFLFEDVRESLKNMHISKSLKKPHKRNNKPEFK